MIYPKSYNIEGVFYTRRGIILIDILLAFSLSLIFIVAITSASAYSRDIFDKAKERNVLLDRFESDINSGSGLFYNGPYGNDRIEISSTSIPFTAIRAASNMPINTTDQSALCSVDFTDDSTIGSYDWIKKQAESTSTYSIGINIMAINLPINPSMPLTDLEVRGNIFYVSANSSIASDADIFVLQLNNSAGIVNVVSSLNTGPGIASFVIAGKYIYAAALSTAAQLHVIQIDSAHNLSLLKKYKFPLLHATDTSPLGSSVGFYNGNVYLGTEKWVGDEFSVIDVSNPSLPNKLSGVEIGSKAGYIYTHDDVAYVATAGQNQMELIDVRDLSNPTVLANFSPSGWQRQEGQVVSSFEGRLNFGRTSGGYNVTTDHEAFIFASTSPFNAASFKSTDIPGGVYGFLSDRFHEYVITRQSGQEFQIFDSTMNASTSLKVSLPTSPQSMTCYGDKIYVLSRTSPTIYEISITRKYH